MGEGVGEGAGGRQAGGARAEEIHRRSAATITGERCFQFGKQTFRRYIYRCPDRDKAGP